VFIVHRAQLRIVVGGVACALALTACGDDGGTATAPSSTVAATTTAAPATTAAAGTIPAGTPEAAAADAYKTVFDSNLAFDTKSKFIEDAPNLRTTVDAYTAAGKSFGGIKLTPTAVAITGNSGAVTYDVYFGTTQQYKALKGTIELRSGTWTVTRAEFCSFMASARTPCPA
jgi:iron complex transport system substrate-binding protein